ncbi:hypothetical protein D3C86_1861920 [compost metagenome]
MILRHSLIPSKSSAACQHLAPDDVATDVTAPRLQTDHMIRLVYFITVHLLRFASPLTVQMCVIQMKLQLIRVLCIVLEL